MEWLLALFVLVVFTYGIYDITRCLINYPKHCNTLKRVAWAPVKLFATEICAREAFEFNGIGAFPLIEIDIIEGTRSYVTAAGQHGVKETVIEEVAEDAISAPAPDTSTRANSDIPAPAHHGVGEKRPSLDATAAISPPSSAKHAPVDGDIPAPYRHGAAERNIRATEIPPPPRATPAATLEARCLVASRYGSEMDAISWALAYLAARDPEGKLGPLGQHWKARLTEMEKEEKKERRVRVEVPLPPSPEPTTPRASSPAAPVSAPIELDVQESATPEPVPESRSGVAEQGVVDATALNQHDVAETAVDPPTIPETMEAGVERSSNDAPAEQEDGVAETEPQLPAEVEIPAAAEEQLLGSGDDIPAQQDDGVAENKPQLPVEGVFSAVEEVAVASSGMDEQAPVEYHGGEKAAELTAGEPAPAATVGQELSGGKYVSAPAEHDISGTAQEVMEVEPIPAGQAEGYRPSGDYGPAEQPIDAGGMEVEETGPAQVVASQAPAYELGSDNGPAPLDFDAGEMVPEPTTTEPYPTGHDEVQADDSHHERAPAQNDDDEMRGVESPTESQKDMMMELLPSDDDDDMIMSDEDGDGEPVIDDTVLPDAGEEPYYGTTATEGAAGVDAMDQDEAMDDREPLEYAPPPNPFNPFHINNKPMTVEERIASMAKREPTAYTSNDTGFSRRFGAPSDGGPARQDSPNYSFSFGPNYTAGGVNPRYDAGGPAYVTANHTGTTQWNGSTGGSGIDYTKPSAIPRPSLDHGINPMDTLRGSYTGDSGVKNGPHGALATGPPTNMMGAPSMGQPRPPTFAAPPEEPPELVQARTKGKGVFTGTTWADWEEYQGGQDDIQKAPEAVDELDREPVQQAKKRGRADNGMGGDEEELIHDDTGIEFPGVPQGGYQPPAKEKAAPVPTRQVKKRGRESSEAPSDRETAEQEHMDLGATIEAPKTLQNAAQPLRSAAEEEDSSTGKRHHAEETHEDLGDAHNPLYPADDYEPLAGLDEASAAGGIALWLSHSEEEIRQLVVQSADNGKDENGEEKRSEVVAAEKRAKIGTLKTIRARFGQIVEYFQVMEGPWSGWTAAYGDPKDLVKAHSGAKFLLRNETDGNAPTIDSIVQLAEAIAHAMDVDLESESVLWHPHVGQSNPMPTATHLYPTKTYRPLEDPSRSLRDSQSMIREWLRLSDEYFHRIAVTREEENDDPCFEENVNWKAVAQYSQYIIERCRQVRTFGARDGRWNTAKMRDNDLNEQLYEYLMTMVDSIEELEYFVDRKGYEWLARLDDVARELRDVIASRR